MTRQIRMSAARLSVALVLSTAMLAVVACDGNGAITTADEPAGTATASPASPASAPTEEREATPTAEDRYRDAAEERLRELADSSRHGAEVMAGANVQSDEWRAEARSMLDEFRAHHRDAEQLTPPPGLEDVHAALVAVTGSFDHAADLLADGMESLDVDLLQQAADAISTGLVAIEAAHLEIREARAAR